MAKAYAGVLGPLACGMILARGILMGGGLESTLASACAALFSFAALGWIAGQLAQRLIEESVQARWAATPSRGEEARKSQASAT